MCKVLRIKRNKNGYGFQVIGGFRIRRFSQGCGLTLDAFGWRLTVSFRLLDGVRAWFQYYSYYFRVWNRLDTEPPFDDIKVHCGPLVMNFGRAYGGYLA